MVVVDRVIELRIKGESNDNAQIFYRYEPFKM
jgi:hypothetical protein